MDEQQRRKRKRRTEIIKAFLQHSFTDIAFFYDGLTEEEKKLCTKEEFDDLVAWIQGFKEE